MLAYYGDDFTGSTDVLESLTRGGIETVLFTRPPDQEMLRRFPNVRAIGVAGNSRTMSPAAMDDALPRVYEQLRQLQPKFVHYKTCSTFDSSPTIGSIGRAIDLGHQIFGNAIIPLIVGAPALQRFCVFGNLFARSGLDSEVYRLDRHPTMRVHPVTPMDEADLRVHLARQTDRRIELIDITVLDDDPDGALRKATRGGGCIILFDTASLAHLETVGRLICATQRDQDKPQFVVGSSGVENALVENWRVEEKLKTGDHLAPLEAVDQILSVSGSCSPVTDRQIGWAVEHGFVELSLDTQHLLQSKDLERDVSAIAERVATTLSRGCSVIVHSSRGPNDGRVTMAKDSSTDSATTGRLGYILGQILHSVLQRRRVERVAITGGDTSGCVARELGIDALEMVGPLAPGAPLCVAHSQREEIDRIQFTFKGGQVGHDDFFGTLLSGQTSR